MLEYEGKYAKAQVMVDEIDQTTVTQIYEFLNHPALEGAKIRIMPDCHAGTGSCIGFTMPLNEYVLPSMVGVDIGCGVDAYRIGTEPGLYERLGGLDKHIRDNVPLGFAKRDYAIQPIECNGLMEEVGEVCGRLGLDFGMVERSLATLGGGNHFISIERDAKTGQQWLLIHSGSRNFGLRVAQYHQNVAKAWTERKHGKGAYREMEYMPLEEGGRAYLNDMYVAQRFAQANRATMAKLILRYLLPTTSWQEMDYVESILSVHNFIDPSDQIVRKGAVRALKDEPLLVPLNMRDGTLICKGKGNDDWNQSAPHGAGRRLSRSQAKKTLSLDAFKETMRGIFTTSVGQDTLDEAPGAYKPQALILEAIGPTAEVIAHLQPIYNLKSGKR